MKNKIDALDVSTAFPCSDVVTSCAADHSILQNIETP